VRRDPRGRSSVLRSASIVVGVCAVIGLVWLWPSADPGPETPALSSFEGVYAAEVAALVERPCRGPDDPTIRCIEARFSLREGPDRGTVTTIELPEQSPRFETLTVGSPVLLGHQPAAEGFEYVLVDLDRRSALLLLVVLFVVGVVALGRWRGVTALLGLTATMAVLFFFVVPAILDGSDPLLVSLVGAVLIAYVSLYLTHGWSDRTTVALFGTLGGLAVAAILSVAFMGFATLTGFVNEEAFLLEALGADLDLRGLILGGMIIGALGAIDDITITQTSAVWELSGSDPAISTRRLSRAGMRIGRDHVASTVNTLVLAYAGASMPVLILFVLSDQPPGTIANGEIVATEIVRAIVGSIGLVASVPITTWLATRVALLGRGEAGRHVTTSGPAPAEEEEAGPEEHPIPEHRRDLWLDRLKSARRRDE
jgi:uncharacterized membrane protein